MSEIVIRNGSKSELRFEGKLIADTKIPVELGDSATREFHLSVYSVDGGGFVAVLQYDTTCQHEKSILYYEDVDLFKDVENFYYVFEVNELITDLDQLNRVDREKRLRTCVRISRAYETGMFAFLDLARSRATRQKCHDRVATEPEKPSLLRVFGLKR